MKFSPDRFPYTFALKLSSVPHGAVMKSFLQHLTNLLCVICFTSTGWADELPETAWTVQVDPLTTYLGFVHIQVERRLHPAISLYAGPHARLFSAPTADPEDFLGIGLEAGVRWFPWQKAPTGPWVLIRGVGANVFTDDASAFGGYGSGLVGYTGILWDVLVLSGGAGVQYLHYRVEDLGPKGVFPALHTAIGFAF